MIFISQQNILYFQVFQINWAQNSDINHFQKNLKKKTKIFAKKENDLSIFNSFLLLGKVIKRGSEEAILVVEWNHNQHTQIKHFSQLYKIIWIMNNTASNTRTTKENVKWSIFFRINFFTNECFERLKSGTKFLVLGH